MKDSPFATEADLCAAYVAWMTTHGWLAYPETAGFDLLLVRRDTGHQLGIEAKLTLNAKVVDQILPGDSAYGGYYESGPDFRGVLVGGIGGAHGLKRLLEVCGVMVFTPKPGMQRWSRTRGNYVATEWEFPHEPSRYECSWHDWNPAKRCELPEIVPDVPAGVPAPIQLTPWKIGALKVIALLELQGVVNRTEVRACGVDPRRFCASDGWLKPEGEGRWSRGTLPAFEQQHRAAYVTVLAETRGRLANLRKAMTV